MIALDTNILVRYLLRDDARQFRRVQEVFDTAIDHGQPLFISLIVLSELVWVLERGYKYKREEIVDAVELLLGGSLFEFESKDLVRRAIEDYRAGQAGLADYVIGRIAEEAGCSETVTFDKSLIGAAGFRVL